MSSPLAEIDTDVLAARAATLAALAKYVAEQRDRHKTELAARMPAGSKITGRHPLDDTKSLGAVTMSDPKPEAYVTDHEAFDAYCRATWPDKVETWMEVDPDHPDVIAVLRDHAPHLLTVHSTVPGEVKERALDLALSEDVPGTKRVNKPPVLSVRSTEHARAAVAAMVAASPVLRELEA